MLPHYPKDVYRLFPKNRDLVGMDVESYFGVPLQDPSLEVIGILCIFSKQPMNAPNRLKEYMEIVVAKAASEIERMKSEKLRISLEDQLRHAQKMESIGTLTFIVENHNGKNFCSKQSGAGCKLHYIFSVRQKRREN